MIQASLSVANRTPVVFLDEQEAEAILERSKKTQEGLRLTQTQTAAQRKSARSMAWAKQNKEKVKQSSKASAKRYAKSEKAKETRAKWRESNREKNREYQREYAKKHRLKLIAEIGIDALKEIQRVQSAEKRKRKKLLQATQPVTQLL